MYKVVKDNGSPWIPAVLLPFTAMCHIHQQLFLLSSEENIKSRANLVGSRIEVQKIDRIVHTDLGDVLVDNGDCRSLRIKWPSGHTSGCFSCEVSID